ncbi:mycothiol synthase [Skermania piniformis]|uniref:Mycothiol acetyltransferase n=1 Tax=Skermania pinensis TaxID=39122 RepID=A0ABX8S6H0_9ACTN|nr:mycothiol synthase [Skermania piniformis]QXQ13448.1 mycothiol synthase [Skermania piniformis]
MTGWVSADPALVGPVRELVAAATAADGVAPVSEQVLHSLELPDSARHSVRFADGVLAGYANLAPARGEHPPMAEVVTAPQARGRGIGTDLVRQALVAGGPGTRVWAHGDLPPARAVAARLGLVVVRELLQMRRELDAGLPRLEVPDGIELRTYRGPRDDAQLLRVNNAAFFWHPEQGGWTERELEIRRAQAWFDPNGLFIATDSAGAVLGFHWTKRHPTEPPEGEVYIVGVDPSAQGRGLGRVLTLAGLHHLRTAGLASAMLYTEADNIAAVRTYDRLGFHRSHVDVAYAVPSDNPSETGQSGQSG